MNLAIRLADTRTREVYPLPVDRPANWYAGPEPNTWCADVALPAVPAEHIVVPSYMQLPACESHYFEFCNGETRSKLQRVPGDVEPASRAQTHVVAGKEAVVSTHIDCWHTLRDTGAGTITVVVQAALRPRAYLLVVGLRPLDLAPKPPLSGGNVILPLPATISQMQADASIAQRICSPTALQMAMTRFAQSPTWEDTIAACFDPISNAYGSWPMAIHWASAQGIVAAVEVFNRWEDVLVLLQQQIPLVCSIRFAQGQLQDAPLTQSQGHLVLLYGVQDNEVLVKDPAGEDHGSVERRYPLAQFISAWLSRRGAGYVLAAQPARGI
ncbi:MAG: C39 family peptidase [bacterium]